MRSFEWLRDPTSQRDMDFDWADETLHADWGRRWLRQLLCLRGWADDWPAVLEVMNCQGEQVARA